MAEAIDPRAQLARSAMHRRQVLAIAVCVALNALDGFDVLSISFASPGIAAEWGIDRAALGVVLSMELVGMAVGSLLLGPVADSRGRRPTALLCLIMMAAGMFATTQVGSIGALAATRLLTGVGIGGMLTCINAMTAEYANDRWRATAVAVLAAGYPMGAIVGGSVATGLLETGTWRDVFTFGAVATVAFVPAVLLLTPETVGFVMHRRAPNMLARVNRALRGIGQAEIAALAETAEPERTRTGWTELFAPKLRRVTALLTLGYFFHIMTFYFMIKWIPKIVVDMGFTPAAAGGVLVWANVGGLLGSLVFSALVVRAALRGLLAATLAGSVALVIAFGQSPADLSGLSWAAAVAGFFTNAGVVGLYAIMAAAFPTAVRAGGTGVVIGFGRGGSALGPVVAGLLFAAGFGLPSVAVAMALGSLVAAMTVLGLPNRSSAA